MARNASGTHSLPTGNPVVAGTIADPVAHNATMSDLSAEITDSLSRSGKGGMSAPLVITAGSATAPSIAPTGDSDTGFYAPAANEIGISTGGTLRVKVTSAGIEATGGSFTGAVAMNAQKVTGLADGTAATDAVTLQQLNDRTAGTPTHGTNWSGAGPGDGTQTYLNKTPGGVVQLDAVTTAAVPAAAWSSIMTLPAGYRPAAPIRVVGIVTTSAGPTTYPYVFLIQANGVVSAEVMDNGSTLVAPSGPTDGDLVRFSATFLAA